MTPQLQTALCEHAVGNLRLLMNMANELLDAAVRRELDQIDEKLFFETFDIQAATKAAKGRKP
jgi:general secretion pathway protein A